MRIRLSIGAQRDYPSWNWIGPDLAGELSRYFDVSFFDYGDLPDCDVALVIKRPLDPEPLEKALQNGTKLIYLPVDYFKSPEDFAEQESFLKNCSMFLVHCERLEESFKRFSKPIGFVNHHNKYGLEKAPPFRADGFVLWVGEFLYTPFVIKWASESQLQRKLLLLTNPNSDPIQFKKTADLAQKIGVDFNFTESHINGYPHERWSIELQTQLMFEAKAAVDIKGGIEDFNQWTKPPTKAQKYMASGLPFACNQDAYAWQYFQDRAFPLATVEETDRWFSKDYWQQVQAQRADLQEELSLPHVGREFKNYIDQVLKG